jgi:hypothetical protein
MSRWALRVGFLAGILALGWWSWRVLFPDPERIIRERLIELAQAAAVPANEAPLAGLLNTGKLAGFFAPDVRVSVDVPGHSQVTFSDREDLLKAVAHARSMFSGLKVEFHNIRLTIAGDKLHATAHLTARAKVPGDSNLYVEELKVFLKKIEGTWRIIRAEGVRTLSFAPMRHPCSCGVPGSLDDLHNVDLGLYCNGVV